MVDWLPKWGQEVILLNPMVHCFEVFRAGYFGSSVVMHYSYGYFSVHVRAHIHWTYLCPAHPLPRAADLACPLYNRL